MCDCNNELFWCAFDIFQKHWFHEKSVFKHKKKINCNIKKKMNIQNVIEEENNLFFRSIDAKYITLYSQLYLYQIDKFTNKLIKKGRNKFIRPIVSYFDTYTVNESDSNICFNYENNILTIMKNERKYLSYIPSNYFFYKHDKRHIYFSDKTNILIYIIKTQKKVCVYNTRDIISYNSFFYVIDNMNNVRKNKYYFDPSKYQHFIHPCTTKSLYICSNTSKIIFVGDNYNHKEIITINTNGEIFMWVKYKKQKEYQLKYKSQLMYEGKILTNIEYIEYFHNSYIIYTSNNQVLQTFSIGNIPYCHCMDNIFDYPYINPNKKKNSMIFLSTNLWFHSQKNTCYFLTKDTINSISINIDSTKYYIVEKIENISFCKLVASRNFTLYLGFENGRFQILENLLN